MQNLNNIAFFWIGEDITIPTMLVRSIRMAFGQNFNIFQLSDRDTPMVEGVTVHKRLKLSQHIMVARLEAYAAAPVKEPTLFVDADMLVLRPFDLPMLAENEVGVTLRGERDNLSFSESDQTEFPEFAEKDTLQAMPYIFSFVYVRSTLLFLRQVNALRKMPKRFQRWYGDQVTLKSELDALERFTVKPFDIDLYNRTVKSRWEFEEVLSARDPVYLVHFKGPHSKQAMYESLSLITKLG
jgi:hypothetical protein